MTKRLLLPTAGLAALLLIGCQGAESPSDDMDPMAPHDESVSERSFAVESQDLAQYAAECDAEIGVTVPDFNCDDGTLVPTTNHVDGKCDQPNRLNQECDPGSKFQVLVRNAESYVVAHCRKRGLGPGQFADIAVIQHNKLNGATCFYQALGTLDGRVKAPSKGQSAWRWLSPRATANIGCAGCHDNGPLVRSPYLTQITGPNALPGAHDFSFNRNEPYRFVGSDFATWKVYKVEVEGNTCNGCHRMARNNVRTGAGTALDLGLRATATGERAKNPHSAASPIWMTPGSVTYRPENEQAAQEIAACAAAHRDGAPLPPRCKVSEYTAPAPVDKFRDGSVWRGTWCSHPGAQFAQGDFNGDRKNDFFCHDPAGTPGGKTWVMLSNGASFVDGNVWLDGWCSHPDSTMGTGDFNADGKTDLYCHDPMNNSPGKTWIAISTGSGFVDGSAWLNNWCGHAGASFSTGDFNGDGRTDLYCHDPMNNTSGRTWVALSTGSGFADGSAWLNNWCGHAGATFATGDFNGDKKTDFYCKDPMGSSANGKTWVALSTGAGFAGGGVWLDGWCSHAGASFTPGDFNGDGKTDFACHDPMASGSSGRTWITLSTGAGFADGSVWLNNWCGHAGASFDITDVTGDGKSDLVCHGPIQTGFTGRTWVAVSTGTGFTDGQQWQRNWCSHTGALFGTGDFTGDGKSDLFCHDPLAVGSPGMTWIAVAP